MTTGGSAKQISHHLHQVFYGGNWTDSNLHDQLKEVSWSQAIDRIEGFNTIAMLTYHIGYFVAAQLHVFQGDPIKAHDRFSYDHPAIDSEEDWNEMVRRIFSNVDALSKLIGALPDQKLESHFVNEKYGTYHRNILGLIEHTHYHLGQIALLKKLITSR